MTMVLTEYVIHAAMPVKCPSPKPCRTYSSSPAADGYRAPSLAKEQPLIPAMIPASAKDSQTAAPATSPAAPRSENIPAPTMAATPIKAACGHEIATGLRLSLCHPTIPSHD